MSPDIGMAVGVGLTILILLIVPALLLVYGAWRVARARAWPRWVPLVAVPLGIMLATAATFFGVFRDLGQQILDKQAAPTIEIQVPQGHRGTVLVFFADGAPALQPIGANRYRVEVPKSGSQLAGSFPDRQRLANYVKYELSYPDGTRPRLTTPSSSGGAFKDASFARFFVGSAEEYRDDYEARLARGKLSDEQDVLEKLRAQHTAIKL